MGVGTTRIEDRILAARGEIEEATTEFDNNNSVMNAGVLFAIPALYGQGLESLFKIFNPLNKGYYGLKHIILLMCFMALCRIKSAEDLKGKSVGELGKLLGLDRVPEVGCFRSKVSQLVEQNKCDEVQKELYTQWEGQMNETIYYIDGHVRIYWGNKAKLTKKYISRQKLCLTGTTEYWVNTQEGLPLLCIIGDLTDGLKQGIESFIKHKEENEEEQTLKDIKESRDKVWFTIVFDREAYEPNWFKKLWKEYHIAVITYRKNVKDKWEVNQFSSYEINITGNEKTMYLCEQGTLLQNLWFREVRSLLESGHQTAIMTTHPTLEVPIIAKDMFSRWTQENYFKYAVANFDLDYMTTYIHENADTETKVVNPEYRELTNKISKTTYKKKRIQANISEMSNNMDIKSVDLKKIDKINTLIEQVKIYDEEINELRTNRKQMKNKLTVGELPEEMRYNILNKESKKLKNIIVMLAYRAESTLKNIVNEIYKYSNKEGRILLKQIFVTDADIKVDKENKTLTVTLHTMSTTRHNTMVVNLCQVLNESEVYYPGTELRLIYKSHAF